MSRQELHMAFIDVTKAELVSALSLPKGTEIGAMILVYETNSRTPVALRLIVEHPDLPVLSRYASTSKARVVLPYQRIDGSMVKGWEML